MIQQEETQTVGVDKQINTLNVNNFYNSYIYSSYKMPKIVVFETKKKKSKFADKMLEHLPFIHPNFRLIIVAPAGSGKTQIMANLIFRKEFMLQLWKKTKGKVVSFIPSHDVVEVFAELAHKNKFNSKKFRIHPNWNKNVCEQEYRDMDPDHPNLFIFDDVAFLDFSSHMKKNIIDELFCAGRHSSLSCMITAQKYSHLNENVRCNNATSFLILYGLSHKELDRIYEEQLSDIMTQDKYKDIIKTFLNEQYRFIWIDKVKRKLYDDEFKEISTK